MKGAAPFRRGATGRRWALLAVAVMSAASAALAVERVALSPTLRPRIVNGLPTQAHPTTAAMLYSPTGPLTLDNAAVYCSGTLVGCSAVLVAGHCAGDPDPSRYAVYLQHAGIVPVAAVIRHPLFSAETFPRYDLALLQLADQVTGIAPSPINRTDPLPLLPLTGTIVGFGQQQGGAMDYGIKRAGSVLIESCPVNLPGGATDADLLCWNFTAPIGPPGDDSNTCNGDSGGPLFVDTGSGSVLAGVTSGGSTHDCLADDISYDANVFTYSDFIDAFVADAGAACGGLPVVGEAGTSVLALAGTLGPTHPVDEYTFAVPEGSNALRVTLNGTDDGLFDPDLYVRAGPDASTEAYDCAAAGASAFGACTFDLPAAGTWSIAVERYEGSGDYQLTATLFGGPPPQCGNGVREFNEMCDGGDAALCPGLCESDCDCPPPVCGNGIAELGEICDGDDAASCPGACLASCACPLPCSEGALTRASARLRPNRVRVRGTLRDDEQRFTGVDPRDGFTVTLTQGAATLTLDVPAGDPGWARSRPDRGRYLWVGAHDGLLKVKAIDRSARNGTWKIIVVGGAIPGSDAFSKDLPIDLTLTMGDAARCATGTAP